MRLPLRCIGRLGHARADDGVVFVVRSYTFEPADGDRFGFAAIVFLDTAAPARRFAWAIAGASENSGKNIGFPVHEIRVGVSTGGDQADVFGNRRVCGTGPLTIDHFMKVVGNANIGRLHPSLRE